MPRKKKTAEQVGAQRIASADRRERPPVGRLDSDRDIILMQLPKPRVAAGPEPVGAGLVNWREPESWEVPLVIEARLRERRGEMALFRGLIG